MRVLRFAVWTFSIGLIAPGADMVFGQNYPNKPIRIVTSAIGGGPDFVSRIIAQGISGPLGQAVIVDNRSSGVIQAEIVSRAAPDGYTLLLASNVLWILPLMQDVPYDPVRDFSPITLVASSPAILVVNPSLPVHSVKELIALAKAKPGALNYASSATGSATHLAGELFKALAGVNIVRVPYKGAAPAITDVIGGQVQLTFFSAPSVMPHVKTGKLRALAVTSAQPSALYPELPTIAAAGLPGYESGSIYVLFAPAKMPAAIIRLLNQKTVQVLRTPETKEKLLNIGSEVEGSSPERVVAMMKSEMARMGKLIKEAGIRAE